MARKIRIAYAGAAYHVMALGNQERDIYADDRDHKLRGLSKPPHLKSHFHKCQIGHGLQGV